MSDILAPWDEPIWPLPSFMRANDPIFLEHGEITDWWCPHRSDDDAADFASGAVYFAAAVQFGKRVRDDALANICGRLTKFDPVELGFLDALARKATVGIVPDQMDYAFLCEAVARHGDRLTFESVRHGEADARGCLNTAREYYFHELVSSEMREAIAGRYGRAGFIWTICRAAMTGGAN